MAVVSVKPVHNDRGSKYVPDGKDITLAWRIRTNNPLDTEDDVAAGLFSAFLIRIGVQYDIDPAARCVSVTFKQLAPMLWFATAVFSTKQDEQKEDPTTDDIVVEWETETFPRTIDRDRNGEAIMNSAGDFFNPLPELDIDYSVAVVEANVPFAVPSYFRQFRNSINNAGFQIDGESIPAEQGYATGFTLKKIEWRNSIPYRKLNYKILVADEFDPDGGHKLSLLDAGFRYRDTAGNLHRIPDADEPVPLDGAGAILADPQPDTAVFRDFDVRALRAFAGNLPGCS